MEIEYKWEFAAGKGSACPAESTLVRSHIVSRESIDMRASYYDTPDGYVKALHGSLRIRRENGSSICCLKLAAAGGDGYKARREFEVESDDIRAGLELLVRAGAPQDVCADLLAREFETTCETAFTRDACTLECGEGDAAFAAELALDTGQLRRAGKTGPIHEVELEYKSGSVEAFHAYAQRLQEELGLVVQPLSKLARAMSL